MDPMSPIEISIVRNRNLAFDITYMKSLTLSIFISLEKAQSAPREPPLRSQTVLLSPFFLVLRLVREVDLLSIVHCRQNRHDIVNIIIYLNENIKIKVETNRALTRAMGEGKVWYIVFADSFNDSRLNFCRLR